MAGDGSDDDDDPDEVIILVQFESILVSTTEKKVTIFS